ncbi:MAG: hypothetical protein IKP91_00270 [Bacteroidaceae bacterium]|nr:hypothetical protein [Bacteroidaceae bacterium]
MINSFHCDEKTVFFDIVILMSENTKIIRKIWIIGRQKSFLRTANGRSSEYKANLFALPSRDGRRQSQLGEFDEWRCGVELRTPNVEEFFETRMTIN